MFPYPVRWVSFEAFTAELSESGWHAHFKKDRCNVSVKETLRSSHTARVPCIDLANLRASRISRMCDVTFLYRDLGKMKSQKIRCFKGQREPQCAAKRNAKTVRCCGLHAWRGALAAAHTGVRRGPWSLPRQGICSMTAGGSAAARAGRDPNAAERLRGRHHRLHQRARCLRYRAMCKLPCRQ